MNCFYHPSTVAIGTCKHCGKGLCADCANDLGHGLACRDKHEQEVEDAQTLFNNACRFQKKADETLNTASRFQGVERSLRYVYPSFFGLLGFAFLYPALFSKEPASTFQILTGSVFLVYALIQGVSTWRALR